MAMSSGLSIMFFFFSYFIISLVLLLTHKTSIFEICYTGGRTAFDLAIHKKIETDEFQRQIRVVKDRAIQQSAASAAISANMQHASMADELQKYSAMLSQGVITQEEFNKIKAKLIQ